MGEMQSSSHLGGDNENEGHQQGSHGGDSMGVRQMVTPALHSARAKPCRSTHTTPGSPACSWPLAGHQPKAVVAKGTLHRLVPATNTCGGQEAGSTCSCPVSRQQRAEVGSAPALSKSALGFGRWRGSRMSRTKNQPGMRNPLQASKPERCSNTSRHGDHSRQSIMSAQAQLEEIQP